MRERKRGGRERGEEGKMLEERRGAAWRVE